MRYPKVKSLLPPHPATVIQRRAAPAQPSRSAHPATVAKRPASLPAAQKSPHPAAVLQPAKRIASVSAYRLERDEDEPKITNTAKGKLKLSDKAKDEGISISFGSDEHVSYFLDKHKGGYIVVLEIKKAAYDAIQEKLTRPSSKVGGQSLSKPSACSDAVMKDLAIESNNVLSFSSDWANYLEANMSVISLRKDD